MQWESARVFVKKVNRHNNGDDGNTRSIFAEDAETSNSPQDGNVRNIRMDDTETSNGLHDKPGRHITLEHSAVLDEPHEMTMTHGFYAGMGSYCIDVDLPDDLSWKPPRRAYLTARGLEYLIEKGGLSLPPKETIAERSKSDALAKTLVCLQAGYIIVQCISRLSSGLPLTFLEINTLGHVLCALIMYSFWFHKPQDLTLSFALESSFAKQLGNWYACCFDQVVGYRFCDLYKTAFDRAKTARSSKVFGSRRPQSSTQTAATALRAQNVFEGFPQESDVAILGGDDCILLLQLYNGSDEDSKQMQCSGLSNIFTAVYYVNNLDLVPKHILENPRVRHWNGTSFFREYNTIIERLFETETEPLDYTQEYLEEETSNWPSAGLLSGHTILPPLAIAISTALYGGLHAAAWHSFFPTEVEKWFWRVSSIVIAASGLIFAYGMVSYHLYLNITLQDYQYFAKRVARALDWVMELLSLDGSDFWLKNVFGGILFLGTCCVISRLYLVIESFISLRKVPVEVYQTPDWTQWIPHL
jgi:hypothetical protein